MSNLPNFVKNYMMQGMSPQNILQKMNINNPIFNNLISMAQKGDQEGLEKFARNVMKERGKDFDKEFAQFKSSMK